jgi:hypothetical protein
MVRKITSEGRKRLSKVRVCGESGLSLLPLSSKEEKKPLPNTKTLK